MTPRILKTNRRERARYPNAVHVALASVAGFVVLLADGLRRSMDRDTSGEPVSVEQMRRELAWCEERADVLRHELKGRRG